MRVCVCVCIERENFTFIWYIFLSLKIYSKHSIRETMMFKNREHLKKSHSFLWRIDEVKTKTETKQLSITCSQGVSASPGGLEDE